jgi:hypothetical protein
VHDSAYGNHRDNKEERDKAHARLLQELSNVSTLAAAHEFGSQFGAPEEKSDANDEHG